MRAAWCPSHLLLLDEAFGNDLIDCRLHKSGGDSFPAPKAFPVCRCQRSCQFCQGLVGVSRMWVSVGTVRNRGEPPVREHQPPTAHLREPAAKGFEEFIVEQGAPNLKEEMGATP